MAEVVLALGPVLFSDFEVPERISFGGAQRLAVHKLPGGARVIDALGRDDAELSWSGVFTGPEASMRARALDLLRVQGVVLPLSWDAFFYSVVIAGFEAEYANPWWIPYRLRCAVLRDEADVIVPVVASVAIQAVSDLANAVGLLGGTGVSLSAAQVALGAAGATTLGTVAYGAAQSALAGAQANLSSNFAVSEAQMGTVAAGGLGDDAGSAIIALRTATGAAGQLGALSAAQGYVSRTAVNLANASS